MKLNVIGVMVKDGEKRMIEPEQMGDRRVQAMGLIKHYEELITKKNELLDQQTEEIEKIEQQIEYWKYKYYGVEIIWGVWGSLLWAGLGAIVGGGLVWLILKH